MDIQDNKRISGISGSYDNNTCQETNVASGSSTLDDRIVSPIEKLPEDIQLLIAGCLCNEDLLAFALSSKGLCAISQTTLAKRKCEYVEKYNFVIQYNKLRAKCLSSQVILRDELLSALSGVSVSSDATIPEFIKDVDSLSQSYIQAIFTYDLGNVNVETQEDRERLNLLITKKLKEWFEDILRNKSIKEINRFLTSGIGGKLNDYIVDNLWRPGTLQAFREVVDLINKLEGATPYFRQYLALMERDAVYFGGV